MLHEYRINALFHAILSRCLIICSILFSAFCLLATAPANATVAFARQYHAPCSMCHTVFPQLNKFGRAFYDNGFRVPGEEKQAPLSFRRTVPFSFSTRASLTYDPQANKKVETVWDDLQLHGSGLLTRQDAFYLHHHIFENARGGDIYEAWIQHAFDGHVPVYLRLGQFLQPLAFSPEIQRLTYEEYLVYTQGVGFNDFSFGTPATGIQVVVGSPGDGLQFAFALNQPRRSFEEEEGGEEAEDSPLRFTSPLFANVFLRVQYRSKGTQFGLFSDLGKTNLITEDGHFTDHTAHYGIDAEVQAGKWRVYGLYLTGTHSNPAANGQRGTLHGGFAGADWHFAPHYLAYLRYDHAQSNSSLGDTTVQGPTLGVTGLIKQNWQIQLEYQHRQEAENRLVLSTRLAF